jgi:hypothetical protein
MSLFKQATKKNVRLRLALMGPSGSGKTYSALLIARGLTNNGKIALLDTENESASLYSDKLPFMAANMSPPYEVKKYIRAIQEAEAGGFDCLIIDSLSHAWAGEGGLLQKKEQLDSRGGNSFTNWASITKQHEELKAAILGAKLHLIVTMRSKQEYIIQENEKGKAAPKKVGLAPIQREGMEYEFDVCLDIAMDHAAQASKDRTGLFATNGIFTVGEETGRALAEWLSSGVVAVPVVDSKPVTVNKENPEVCPPKCCGRAMMLDKYDDRQWYCVSCKSKQPRGLADV